MLDPVLIHLRIFIILKILIDDRKLRPKESLFIVWGGLVLSAFWLTTRNYLNFFWIFTADIPFLLFFFFFLHKWKRYDIKKSIYLMGISYAVIAVVDSIVLALLSPLINLGDLLPIAQTLLWFFFHALLFLFTIALTVLFVKITKKNRTLVNQNNKMQNILMVAVLIPAIVIQLISIYFRSATYATNLDLVGVIEQAFSHYLVTFFFIPSVIIVIMGIGFLFIAGYLKAKYEKQVKDTELKSLQYYMSEIEQQYTSTRKFCHDYKNILFSIESFLHDEDIDGLKKYYSSKIKPASEVIVRDDFTLEKLSKINVREIKSIFAVKLMQAQSAGVETSFEVNESIDHFPTDSVALVRMIGIIMDNAIEELTTIKSGKLLVGCFKGENGITIIVQNTCRQDMPKLHRLRQSGFSTKGESRGLGLNILQEIVDQNPNLALETSIEDGNFVQTLRIVGYM